MLQSHPQGDQKVTRTRGIAPLAIWRATVAAVVVVFAIGATSLHAEAWTMHPYHQSSLWQPWYGCLTVTYHQDVGGDWALNARSGWAVDSSQSGCGILQWRDSRVSSGSDYCAWSGYHYDYGTSGIHNWEYGFGQLLSSCGYSEYVPYQLPYYTQYGPLWLF